MDQPAWPAWPEDWRVTDETFDPRRIEEQGKFQLYRALNTQHLIAFVGSGISAAYGRVSWVELVQFHVVELERLIKELGLRPHDHRHDLLGQLRVFTEPGKGFRGDPITALMLCEQVWRLTSAEDLRRLAKGFNLSEDLERRAGQADLGQELFRTWIKRETHNEFAHVLRVLGGTDAGFASALKQLCGPDLVKSSAKAGEFEVLRDLALTLTAPWKRSRADVEDTRRDYAALFSVGKNGGIEGWSTQLDALDLPAEAEWARKFAKDVLTRLNAPEATDPISPVRYFAFGLVLDLLRLYGQGVLGFLGTVLKSATNASAADFKSRDSLIPRSTDPLREMAYGLSIRRFATTNYDLEIERFFHDMAFETRGMAQEADRSGISVRVGPLGARTRDFVLSNETVADLIDFATDDNAYAFEVVHLHGRATEKEPIVVTERDYQNVYVREDRLQAEINEAREAAFGGNPIFFTGFGMSESDVMRPLREFVTGPVRHNRAVIALLAADKSRPENDSFAMDQYVKHGVSVIRYDFDGQPPGKPDKGWLCVIFEAIEDLKKQLRNVGEKGLLCFAADTNDEKRRSFGEARKVLEQRVKEIADLQAEFLCSDQSCAIGFEFWFLKEFAENCNVVAGLGTSNEHPSMPVVGDGRSPDAVADVGAIIERWCNRIAPALLDRVKVAIQTAILCSKLAAIRTDWQKWWREWQRAPVNRSDFRQYSKRSPGGAPIWSRHRVNEHHEGVEHERPSSWKPGWFRESPAGRRCIVITSRNGFGKGHLYSYLTNTSDTANEWGIAYLGQFFTTFGYDSEIASVWDALPMFLLSPAEFPLLGHPQDRTWQALEDAEKLSRKDFQSWSRLERLHRSLQVAQGHLERACKSREFGKRKVRLLIAFNVFDLLFDTDGREAQREIRDFFRVLLAKERAHLPIDLLFVVRDKHLPAWFRLHDTLTTDEFDGIDDLQLLMPSPEKQKSVRYQEQFSKYEETVRVTLERSRARLIKSQRGCARSFDLCKAAELTPGSRPSRNVLYVLPPPDPMDFRLEPFDKVREFLADVLGEGGAGESLQHFFHRQLNSNRYAYVLVIMIARDILEGPEPNQRKRLGEFLRAIELMPHNFNGGVPDRFFELVLDFWFEQRAPGGIPHGSEDPELDELLIRHIGVISMPVQAAVLARGPRIDAYVRKWYRGEDPNVVVERALRRLVERGLVFHIDRPDPNTTNKSDPNEDRYHVHRSIRAHVHRRLGSQQTQPATAYVYGPSLYAAQARNFPRLNAQAYSFLCELLDKLSFYPHPDMRLDNPKSEEDRRKCANCLRAALGIVRNLCSLGAITRFADADSLPPLGTGQMGYLERHRLVIRWMLRLAAWLNPPRAMNPPFYRDETIWLYNECGVFSHAQGRCYDARAFFERALQLQEEIDGARGGPMRRRILLNAALSAIDAGRLTLARRYLEEVEPKAHEDRLSRLLAVGFLGWIDHLSGELSRARERYDESIAGLKQLELIRPIALIKQFSGFLHLHLDEFDRARNEFRDVIQLAEAGGYADLGHYARLNEAKAYVRDPQGEDRIDSALRRLEAAQDYADRMDIPRLSVDVLLFGGEILLEQGELTRAGQLMARGLQLANLNGMMFRRIFAMEWLSHVYEARKKPDAALRLREYTLRAARACGYHLSVFRTKRAVF